MDAFEAYQRFLAFRSHFTRESYDGFKYQWKVKTNIETFLKRNDRFFFGKLGRHKDPDGLMIANFLVRDDCWIHALFDDSSEDYYNEMMRRQGTLTYNFKKEIKLLGDDFNEALKVKDGQHPPLLRKYISKEISPETIIVIDELTGVFKEWDKKLVDQVFWPTVRHKLKKYRPFLTFKKDVLRQVIVDNFSVS